MDNLTFLEAIEKWESGQQLSNYSLYGVSFVWIGRFGQILQFIGSLTVIAEILGREKVIKYKSKVEKLINLRVALKNSVIDIRFLIDFILFHFKYLGLHPADSWLQKTIKEKYKTEFNSDVKSYLKYRKELHIWIQNHDLIYKKWRIKKNKILPVNNRYTAIFLRLVIGFALIMILVFLINVFTEKPFDWEGFLGFVVLLMIPFLRLLLYNLITLFVYVSSILLFPILIIPLSIIRVIFFVFIEILIFKPLSGYLNLSTKESYFKLTGFILVFIGFLSSLFAS